jgi:hypothetical protein
VEGYTKPSAKLEINVDVKYVGEDERTDGLKGELARLDIGEILEKGVH